MVTTADIPHFFTDLSLLTADDYVLATYEFSCTIAPRLAAAGLCAEQSTAMWQRVGSSEDLRTRFGAKVIDFQELDCGDRFAVTIAHPHHNFGPLVNNLLVALAGEGVCHAPGITTIKLVDLELPPSYLQQFAGPQFGLAQLREQFRIYDRPFFIGVVKPNIGLPVQDFAQLAGAAWEGGLDWAKDDEMLANTTWSRTVDRVMHVTTERMRAERATGQSKGFIANITDDPDRSVELCRDVTKAGANMVMLNPAWTGLGTITAVRRASQVPVMGHFAGLAVMTRPRDWGVAEAVLVKLMRLAGADIIALPGFGPRMHTLGSDVRTSIHACLEPMAGIAQALPVPGGSDWAGTLESVCEHVGHSDFGFIAGRGIFGHPQGPSEGAESICAAWDALKNGVNVAEYAAQSRALDAALKAWQ